MKKILAICVCCTVVLCFTFGTATAAAKIPIIFATSADSNPKAYSHMAYLKFAELANKYSDNAFDFKYFPNSQMGDEIETVRAIQLGTVHMSNLGTNNFAVYAPSVGWYRPRQKRPRVLLPDPMRPITPTFSPGRM